MPFAALVIIHLDIMISFFSFYSSPKHITKKKNHLVICTSTHTVRSIKSSFHNNSSGFHKCSLTFGHSAMSRWKPQARKLKSEKSVQSYCRDAWNWLYLFDILQKAFGVHLTAWNQSEEPQLHLWNCSIAHNRNLHLQSWIWTTPAEEKEQGDQWLTVNPQSDRHAHSSTVWIHNKLQLFLFQSGCLILWLCI